jgi:nicotinamidase-related amidase
MQDLAPLEDEIIIEKKFASAFFQTTLVESLIKLQVDSIVVSGVTTSGCVRATAVDSLQNNFSTTVAKDCVGDRDLDAHVANLHDLKSKYADVIDSILIL